MYSISIICANKDRIDTSKDTLMKLIQHVALLVDGYAYLK